MNRASRFLTLLFALFQLTLPGALRVMDALNAADSRGSAPHVEETSGSLCRAAHTDECLVCRYLSTGATGSRPQLEFAAPTAHGQLVASAWIAPASGSHLLFRSRAPPETSI